MLSDHIKRVARCWKQVYIKAVSNSTRYRERDTYFKSFIFHRNHCRWNWQLNDAEFASEVGGVDGSRVHDDDDDDNDEQKWLHGSDQQDWCFIRQTCHAETGK